MTERTPRNDDGMSMIELVVYAVIAALLLGVLGGILISGMRSTVITGDRDAATGTVQAISTSLSSDIRNASSVQLTQSGSTTVVRARVADGRSAWDCRAYAVVDLETWSDSAVTTGADGKYELRVLTYDDVAVAASFTAPTPTTAWGVLSNDVQRIEVQPTPSPAPTPTYLSYFTLTGDALSWNLAALASANAAFNDGETVALTGSAVARAHDEGTTKCW
ncbi:hypothetical protein ACFQRL_13465 [Microbacterium fluvii]|uniref:Prepilin-type N-terminal cleavage/methylation domain-containing protein n=1 Tax=Microbacterium fluvii TaxID=415215 RepID=A0ABW2HG73_9MICO|nr:hypothetical protein [Microbacterium fluvii]MCU4673598.1 hypothetical protein [Microbacterium fluvii]